MCVVVRPLNLGVDLAGGTDVQPGHHAQCCDQCGDEHPERQATDRQGDPALTTQFCIFVRDVGAWHVCLYLLHDRSVLVEVGLVGVRSLVLYSGDVHSLTIFRVVVSLSFRPRSSHPPAGGTGCSTGATG
ncbi:MULTISPECIES: hypothetical protein [Mycolicibacterium]|uniref:hypothetical protein n=1 Tax=Mycolicibacterium TaxID=1866885 RepID=UPI000D6AF4F8